MIKIIKILPSEFEYDKDYEEKNFKDGYKFDERNIIKRRNITIELTLPLAKKDGRRWNIFKNALVDGITVGEAIEKAKQWKGGQKDIYLGLLYKYIELE